MVWLQNPRGWLFGAVAVALALCPGVGVADEADVVVLRSGGVLHGAVSVSGERYVITSSNSVVDVPAPQVLLVAHSMEDAYQQQRRKLPADVAEAHLGLADWCLRYELLEPAKQELTDARRLDARDPRVGLLERRLTLASTPKAALPAQAPPNPRDDNASNEELAKLIAAVRDLPPGAVERFTRKVQPLLVNSCTTSGCHQAGGQQNFQLDRAVLHGLANRRITLRNLVATLELVDDGAPQNSELVKMLRHKHGGMDHPIFGSRQEPQLTQILDWVDLVAQGDARTDPSIAQSKNQAPPIKPSNLFGDSEYDLPPSRFLDREVTPASFDGSAPSEFPQSKVKFGAEIKPVWQPKDEFDPEIFNRQKSGAATHSSAANAPPATH